jgi:nucleoside-diphosphate-sugar epimerase
MLEGVTGSDIVLHVGGMVSPSADYYPKRTLHTNITAAKNLAKAVLAQPNADDIKVVYIGTVAQTSDRNEPIHWGRAGDPICISVYDHYAMSKTEAEKIIVELKNKFGGASATLFAPDASTGTMSSSALPDLLMALEALGYRRLDIIEMAQKLVNQNPTADISKLVPMALKEISKGK